MTAAARAREAGRDDRLFEDPWAVALAGAEGFKFLARQEAIRGERPEAVFVVRHRFFDDFLVERVRDGVRQVVLVAAGLDTRAFRLDWPLGLRLFELDQPEVLSYKQAILDEAGATPACDRQAVPVDLREDWALALLSAGYTPDAPTAWLAEGLLFYLPEQAVYTLLEKTAELSCAGSSLGTDTMPRATLDADSTREWINLYEEAGAPFMFGTDGPAELLAEHGWQPSLHSYEDIARELQRSWPFAPGPEPRGSVITASRVS
jgi:methyltransferase (TIGR00027 family)